MSTHNGPSLDLMDYVYASGLEQIAIDGMRMSTADAAAVATRILLVIAQQQKEKREAEYES